MSVNLGLRRIASLSAFLVAMSIASASQAGVIPWAYDAIFGPVRYPTYRSGYAPYAVSYSRPVSYGYAPVSYAYAPVSYAPVSYGHSSGCSSCSTSYYAPVSYAQPSYGCGCAPVAVAPSCSPCGGPSYASANNCLSGCSSSPNPKSTAPVADPTISGKSAWKKPAEPGQEPVLAPKTFQSPNRGASPAGATSQDGLGTGTRSRGTPANEGTEVEVNRPAPNDDEPTILKPKKAPAKPTFDELEVQPEPTPAKPKEEKFEQPFNGDKPGSDATDGNSGQTIRLPRPKVNLDAKIAWRAEPQRTRVPFHAKIAKASVTRRVPSIDSDWTPVVSKPTGTQVVRK